jgi:hypothetical protein
MRGAVRGGRNQEATDMVNRKVHRILEAAMCFGDNKAEGGLQLRLEFIWCAARNMGLTLSP